MSSAPAAAPQTRPAHSTPAVIILGTDALLAVRPATPGQLANACYGAGYSAVIPGSWGDELVAAGCLKQIAARGQGPVVLCSCPRVAEPMRRAQSVASYLLSMVPPPVAAARYLRSRAGLNGVHITYVGECPGATDPSIDRHATPAALLRSLAKRGINPMDQPTEVEERLLRDGRRFYSLPGGAPAPNWLYAEKRGYTLVEPMGRDYLAEVAHRLAEKERRIIDLAPRLGCACSGAVVGESWSEAREIVAAIEPPRAVHEILDHDMPIELATPIEPWTGSADIGQQTMSIPLDELAALYDPEAKAAPVRTAPPPPLPSPRTSRPSIRVPGEPPSGGGAQVTGEPASGPRMGVLATTQSRPHARRDDEVFGGAEASLAALAEITQESLRPAAPVERVEHDSASHHRYAVASVTPDSDIIVPSAETSGVGGRASGRVEPASWPSGGPRTTGSRLDPITLSSAWPPAANRRTRWGVAVGVCVVIAAAITGVFHARSATSPALAARSGAQSRTAGSRPPPTAAPTPSVPAAPTPASPPDTIGSNPASAGPAALSPSPDSVLPALAPEAVHRLPVGPAPRARARSGPRPTRIRSEDTTLIQFPRNPAPVYAPGAAPIPHAGGATAGVAPPRPSPRWSPAATKAGAAFTNALSPEAAAQMAAIRAEIGQRRHRVDSLKQVVDSLGTKTPEQ